VPLYNINQVNAALQLTAAAALDYSTVLIIDAHHDSFERATVYTDPASYSSIPEGTPLRRALDSAFSASVRPARVVVGRALGDFVLTPSDIEDNETYSFTIQILDGVTETINATVDPGDTAEDLAEAWKTSIDANVDLTDHITSTVVGSGADATLVISANTSDDDFNISGVSDGITTESVITESAADIIENISNFNPDWTYITATDHTPSFQLAMGAQAAVLQKPYFTSTDNPVAYSTWAGINVVPDAEDVGAQFVFNSNQYAHVMYHDRASDYPEVARITEFTFLRPGEDSFNYKPITGFGLGLIQGGARKLNTNELNNLQQRNMSTIVNLGGTPVVAGNRMATGVRIEAIVFSLYAQQELGRRLDTLFLNGRKFGMNDADLGVMENSLTTWLNTNVSTPGKARALDPHVPYTMLFPRAKDISFEDRVDGVVTFEAILYLDASIDSTVLNLTLTYRDPAQG
jgi:hypothetical protein